jgi:predicted dehydrogenase
MSKLRFGIIGCGNMGNGHMRQIAEAKPRDLEVTACADLDPTLAQAMADKFGLTCYENGYELMDSGDVDAVLIATPHFFHPPLAIHAARRGLHVLCEKPLAVTVGPARLMVEECRKAKVALGVVFHQRTMPGVRAIRKVVESGKLGEIYRVRMICSNWWRSQLYYDSGHWRGTWAGEGGGILMNQGPHSLDQFLMFAGMPKRVIASLSTRMHKIEVENTANIILEYEGGKNAYIYATTAQGPGSHEWVIAGNNGALVADADGIRVGKLKAPLDEFTKKTPHGAGTPQATWREVKQTGKFGKHLEVIKRFAAHVLHGKELIADAQDGLDEVELCNAMYLAGFKDRPVDLPVDARAMERMLGSLIREHDTGKSENYRALANKQLKKIVGKLPW